MWIMLGYLLVMYICAAETCSLRWIENRMGYVFRYLPERVTPMNKKNEESESDSFTLMAKKKSDDADLKAEKSAKYQIMILLLLKVLLEYAIVGVFLFTAVLKNNVLEIAFIPVAIICICFRLTMRMSWGFSVYMWICLIAQYFMCVTNMAADSVPQQHDDSVFLTVFQLSKWPAYKTVLADWHPKREWAHYFAMGGIGNTRICFIADVSILCIQALYFQHFCHSFYNLSYMTTDRRGSFGSGKGSVSGEGRKLTGIGKIISFLYELMRKVFFIYSHIFTLCFLLFVSALSSGAITTVYVIFCVVFIQLDLFSNVGGTTWSLPLYIRYVLRPYILLDIIVQFIYQVPYFIHNELKFMPYLGIDDFNTSVAAILLKIAIFTLAIYQEAIFCSAHYRAICRMERMKIKKLQTHRQLCMTYLYNNRRVHEFRRQKYVRRQNHDKLMRVSSSIQSWNEILHRTGGSQKSAATSQAEAGLRLDIEESKQKLEEMREKLAGLEVYPYMALKHLTILEQIYLWVFDQVNPVAFTKSSALPELERKLETGSSLVPNYVIDHHVSQYSEHLKAKIEVETLKLSILEQKLSVEQSLLFPLTTTPAKEEGPEKLLPEPLKIPVPEEKKLEKKKTKPSSGIPALKLISDIGTLSVQMLYSSSHYICFFFMLLAHGLNGNLLSSVYIASVFCYALLVRCRPGQRYWQIMLMYAGVVIATKYIVLTLQKLLVEYAENGQPDPVYKDFFAAVQANCGARLGLFEGMKYSLWHFLFFDELVAMSIIFHLYVMNTMGVLRENEEKVENITAAVERINTAAGPFQHASPFEDSEKLVEEEVESPAAKKLSIAGPKTGFFNTSIGRELFPSLRNEKPGRNYNTALVLTQLLLCVYILLFFSNMSYEFFTLSKIQIKEFSTLTVFALLFQTIFILLDQYAFFMRPLPSSPRAVVGSKESAVRLEFYRTPNYALLGKFCLHLFQVIIVNALVFWYLPNQGNIKLRGHEECVKADIEDGKCNEPYANHYLFLFYMLYCVYFVISAKQIQAGWTEMEEGEVHRDTESATKYTTKVFYAIPFGWELQQLVSWIWSTTSFDLFRWMKFDEIYSHLFLLNCSMKAERNSRLGTPVTAFRKFYLGACVLTILLAVIIAPIFVFSSLNPMVELNNPTQASISVSLSYDSGSSIELIPAAHAIIQSATEKDLIEGKVRNLEEVRGQEAAQFVWITFPNASDTIVFPTEEKRMALVDYLSFDGPYPKIVVKFDFVRPNPSQRHEVEMIFSREIGYYDWYDLWYLFNYTTKSIRLKYESLFCSAFLLPLDEKPREVARCTEEGFKVDFTLELNMTSFYIDKGAERVPKLSVKYVGREWFGLAVSEKSRSSLFAAYSVITLYMSVILVIGRLLRGFVSGSVSKIIYDDIPRPGPLLRLCSGVIIARYDNDLVREEEIYLELIDVLRSTEVIKLITKNLKDMYVRPPKEKEKDAGPEEAMTKGAIEDKKEEEKKDA